MHQVDTRRGADTVRQQVQPIHPTNVKTARGIRDQLRDSAQMFQHSYAWIANTVFPV